MHALHSFNSYSIRRATLQTDYKKKASGFSKMKATKEMKLPTLAEADPTDTVALLSPHFVEVDLWPSVGNYLPAADTSTAQLGAGASPRATFLKEAKVVTELRHLENAMCDIRYVLYKTAYYTT